MKLEVRLDQKIIFATSFPVCRLADADAEKGYENKRLKFSFKAGRPIVWKGYRDDQPASTAGQNIDCDIWMAGADPTAVIIGISFSRPDTILMNTLHIAVPSEKKSSEIEDGLVVLTFPQP